MLRDTPLWQIAWGCPDLFFVKSGVCSKQETNSTKREKYYIQTNVPYYRYLYVKTGSLLLPSFTVIERQRVYFEGSN